MTPASSRSSARRSTDTGMAMITAMLMMLLMSALLVGFTAVSMSDQRFRAIDRDHSEAFYAASAGVEKLTADLGNLFFANVAPTNAQVQALTTAPPSISGVSFTKPDGSLGYTVTSQVLGSRQITQGPYQGLSGLVTTYTIDVTARTLTSGEVHLQRVTEAVAIPVFQFGMFSDVDLSFFAGPNFNFGGRVHTNGNLFLAEGDDNTLTLNSPVTAVKEIVRQRLSNNVSIDTATSHNGTISVATAPNAFRNLARTEGSVTDGLAPPTTNPAWQNISLTTYNGYIRNGATGAKVLNLPLITLGGANTDLVRRPVVNENVTNAPLFGERYYSKVSLRILLSDTAADITGLPTVTATAPMPLGEVGGVAPDWKAAPPAGYAGVDATHPPIARSPGAMGAITVNAAGAAGATTLTYTGALPGFLHIAQFPMTISGSGNSQTITCTSVTPTQFVGCVPTVNWKSLGSNVPTPAAVVNGISYQTSFSTNITAASNRNARTLSLAALGGQTAFASDSLWVADSANASNLTLVSCSAIDTGNSKFTGCSGTPAVAAGGAIGSAALSNQKTGLVGGYIKIEMQKADTSWQDVTAELLNYGIAGPSQIPNGGTCANASNPNAIVVLERLKDTAGACTAGGSQDSYDYWPNALFDVREGIQRDADPGVLTVPLGGVMYYVSLDVANLSKWFSGTGAFAGGSGTQAISNNGYSVYFSDRRNNRSTANLETGEYGFEDVVNPNSATGTPNGILDPGEDVNSNGTLEDYGKLPNFNGVSGTVPGGAAAPLDANARPTTLVAAAAAKVNRPILFRRALKLINGGLGTIVLPGLTIATENPVYIQGDWNMNQNPPVANDGHAETSIVADAVTILSNAWNDDNSFGNVNGSAYALAARARAAAPSYYRFAVIAGKGPAFAQPPAPANNPSDFGTDGGAHNFLRLLESGGTVNYIGSIATFYYNRQATGTYKCCNTVYGAPTRNYQFDTDFTNPATLPPLTPVFRDMNTVGFSRIMLSGE